MEAILSKLKKIDYKKTFVNILNDLFKVPFYILTHPIKGFSEFKSEKLRKSYVAIFYLVLMFLTLIISYNGNGFLVNQNNPENFNALRIILIVVVPVALITVGNWSITSLFDGKGTMIEIFSVICYSIAPFTWIMLPNIIYSNFLIIEEVGFYEAFQTIAIVLMCFMAFFGLLVIHEYGLLKTFVTLIATVIAIGVIIFIAFLFLTLFQQVYSFGYSVYREYVMRFL
ncbi:MAG: Yip1 domain [Haloplasmataceae bacterium]|jgi:hypothetical protein|nr:Yip1 domain [Haloplasmataceae bacterium]